MKSNDHLAYRTSMNYPIHISSPDSVNAHINDELRLIAMDQFEWPKLRGRNFTKKEYTVIDAATVGKLNVKSIQFALGGSGFTGKLVNDKYFFTDSVLNYSAPLELMFESFKELGMRPVCVRSYSSDYCGSWSHLFKLVEAGTGSVEKDREMYHPFTGLEAANIDCLADLLAFSYKFAWDAEKQEWVYIADPHAQTLRIRKPWMAYLCQTEFGAVPNSTADDRKLIRFLLQSQLKEFTDEQQAALEPFISSPVELDDLIRMGERQSVLNALYDAYRSPRLLKAGEDVRDTDPLFSFQRRLYGMTDENVK